MLEFIEEVIQPRFNYWIYVILMMIGLWATIAKNNLIKKLIGLSIFQTAIILFYVSVGVKEDSKIPIVPKPKTAYSESYDKGEAKPPTVPVAPPSEITTATASARTPEKVAKAGINPDNFANPLPHVLMLTAIVVGVATLGVALAIAQMLFKEFGSLEEDEILAQIKAPDSASPDS